MSDKALEVITFGRMKGKTFFQIAVIHNEYCIYLENYEGEKTGQFLELYNYLVNIGRIQIKV